MTNTDNPTQTVITAKRIKYGFELKFPNTFTLRYFRNAKHHKVKYITLYSRVKQALENGEIAIAGLKDPAKARRGRKEIVYKRLDVDQPPVASADVAVPFVTNW